VVEEEDRTVAELVEERTKDQERTEVEGEDK
jgi:hypothetical protein